MDLVTIIVALIIIISGKPLIQWWIKRRQFVNTVNKIPGAKTLFFFGNALDFIGLKRTEMFDKMIAKRHRDFPGGISRLWLMNTCEIHLGKPEFVEKLLSSQKNIQKTIMYDMEFRKWLGNGLVISSGEHWRAHRKVITPTFHFSILEGFCDVFAEKCDVLVKKLDKLSQTGEVLSIDPLISLAALDIICETAMGIKMDVQEKGESEYVKAVEIIAEIALKRFLNPLMHFNVLFNLTADSKKSKETLKILHGFTNKVIAERRVLRKNELSNPENDGCEETKKRRLAFLDLLLEETEKNPFFSDKDIQEEVDTFVFTGHDTATVSTAWAIFLLGHHPEVQEKLYEEQMKIFINHETLPTYKDLGEMKYMDRVMKECIRLYPTVIYLSRTITDEFEVGGYTIPAGAMVGVNIWACSRDERYFPDPEIFNPDRFLPENAKGRHAYAHIPFSAGPRNCIGQKFAQLEEKAMLSAMVRNFKIKSVDSREDVKMIPEIVSRPYPGVRVILEKRK